MGDVSLSIAALCHAKNKPELETWFRVIIVLEWERGKLFVTGILCLRRLYRHCKVVLTGVSEEVILQTGSSF